MLSITIPAAEYWDELNNTFVYLKEQTLQLEHSLVSLSNWESKWNKSFFSKVPMTHEETIDYIRCMTLTQDVDPAIYNRITKDLYDKIDKYINAPMTATHFAKIPAGRANNEVITSELIYYWMLTLNIPSEYQEWHFNRLMTLIRVCSNKNQPPKKMSTRELHSRNTALNAARRQQLNSKG